MRERFPHARDEVLDANPNPNQNSSPSPNPNPDPNEVLDAVRMMDALFPDYHPMFPVYHP